MDWTTTKAKSKRIVSTHSSGWRVEGDGNVAIYNPAGERWTEPGGGKRWALPSDAKIAVERHLLARAVEALRAERAR